MRLTSITLSLCLAVAAVAVQAAEPEPTDFKKEHPGDTALSQDDSGNYVYKSFPGLAMLFVYEGDEPGSNTCKGCSSAWLPLLVSERETSERVGDWTVIKRDDGQRQWAYKGKLVYMRYHNMPPDSNSEEQGFHLLTP